MKEKYRCGSCNWKFTRSFMPTACPFCGKPSVQVDVTQPADELLREVE